MSPPPEASVFLLTRMKRLWGFQIGPSRRGRSVEDDAVAVELGEELGGGGSLAVVAGERNMPLASRLVFRAHEDRTPGASAARAAPERPEREERRPQRQCSRRQVRVPRQPQLGRR
jgi:hypothetical protein